MGNKKNRGRRRGQFGRRKVTPGSFSGDDRDGDQSDGDKSDGGARAFSDEADYVIPITMCLKDLNGHFERKGLNVKGMMTEMMDASAKLKEDHALNDVREKEVAVALSRLLHERLKGILPVMNEVVPDWLRQPLDSVLQRIRRVAAKSQAKHRGNVRGSSNCTRKQQTTRQWNAREAGTTEKFTIELPVVTAVEHTIDCLERAADGASRRAAGAAARSADLEARLSFAKEQVANAKKEARTARAQQEKAAAALDHESERATWPPRIPPAKFDRWLRSCPRAEWRSGKNRRAIIACAPAKV